MELAYWHGRLEQHFLKLKEERRASGGEHHIFALEHGLGPDEIKALTVAVRDHVAKGRPLREHFLAWITYAAEIGYRYSGDEYWRTFESETPGWDDYGNRHWILESFYKFHKDFDGVKPSGRWAEHFRIICWPITHAILPRDLQYQLARLLYELRHSFSAELLASPSRLGVIIKTRSWNGTSRFQQLAQETLLLGQIATALLLEDRSETESLIYPPTLRRIAEDLDRQRQAREWLRGAKRFVQERLHVRGLALHGESHAKGSISEQARAEVAALGLEPRLVLQPTDRLLSSWSVWLDIPELSNLLIKFPLFQDILAGSRCIIAGTDGRPKAREFFLHGPKRVELVRWPRPEEILLQFDRKNPQLEYLLKTECLLRPGSTWLFRIASDGLAYELRSLRVRPGEKYIVVSSDSQLKQESRLCFVNLACTGVSACLLEVPEAITEGWQNLLKSLGLGQAKSIDVWPAGLAAQLWDGEGRGEWLASDRPCLGMSSDHPMDSIHIALGSDPDEALEVKTIIPGQPVFVELPQLPVGLHTVRISSRALGTTEANMVGELKVMIQIRQSRISETGITRQIPLMVQMDPIAPSMEQMWEGRVAVNVYGPARRSVKCRVSLFEKDGEDPSLIQSLQPMALPVNTDDWWERFDTDFRRAAQHKYDSAKRCDFDFSAEELGAFVVRCEREFVPLRWILRRGGNGHILRLVDDSGHTEQPTVHRYAFESPGSEESLKFEKEYEIPQKGGLYVARIGNFRATIIAPPSVRAFTDFKCTPRIEQEVRSLESIIGKIDLIQLWASARLPGDVLSLNWQREVLLTLTAHIFRMLSGDNWWREEAAVSHGNDNRLAVLSCIISTLREHMVIGATLQRDRNALTKASVQDRIECFSTLIKPFLGVASKRVTILTSRGKVVQRTEPPKVENPKWLAELALRLASDPREVKAWAGSELQAGLRRLLEQPLLARAARFLVLATLPPGRQMAPQRRALYPGWQWP